MRTTDSISRIVDDAVRILVAEAHPSRIILFGSAARGDTTGGSDLDFLVVLPEVRNRYLEMVRLGEALSHLSLPTDVLVYSESEVQERGHLKGTALYRALREGRVLHAAA